MKLRHLFSIVLCALTVTVSARAENLPLDSPMAGVVTKYLEAIVKQDWETTADMLQPTSLERRKAQLIAAIKNSGTMTEEAAKLNMIGVKDIAELDKMTPQAAYVADRKSVHDRFKITPENIKRKQETLKITFLGLVSEDKGRIVHALVRTKQETLDTSIEELLLISLIQDQVNNKKWYVVPDMQTPITLPLANKEGGAAAKP